MYLLYCDETNFERTPGDFFLYGGLVIPPQSAANLSAAVSEIRTRHRVPREYVLKFNPGPVGFTHQQFIELKREIIAATVAHSCHILVNLLLHDIATSSEGARRFGINTLCYHFDCYLNRPKQPGLVLIDRFDDRQIDGQLRERLAVGLTGRLPYSAEMPIEHIVGYHFTAVGTSHFSSLVDVLLGSLRFAVNAHTRQMRQHQQSMLAILRSLSPLFLREGGNQVAEISLSFSPKEVRNSAYRTRYQQLATLLRENQIDPAQAV